MRFLNFGWLGIFSEVVGDNKMILKWVIVDFDGTCEMSVGGQKNFSLKKICEMFSEHFVMGGWRQDHKILILRD